ncbi:MAG: TonB-dependent receptor, partial [Bacteroidia bacterium]|nr:TonB-dependent receptor [Bacteroidia bacterium]
AENVPVKNLLQTILANTGLTFVLQSDELIVITKTEFTAPANQLTGTVVDETGEPVPFANVVQLALPDSTFINGVSTAANGRFSVERATDKPVLLEITFLGYERYHAEISDNNNLGTIRLQPQSTQLGEVVVTASRPMLKLNRGALVVNVTNSVLNKETNVLDVLRKIPGMMLKNGELSSFSGGKPAIYINGKKAQSMSEVNRLEVKNIKEVKLNTNPGAEYDASVGAVLEITTLKKDEGWSLQLDADMSRNHKWRHGEAVKLNYKKESLNIFGTFGYNSYGRKTYQLMKTEITNPDTVWLQTTELKTDMSMPYYEYSAGADYEISKDHSIGIVYDGYFYKSDDEAPYTTNILANNAAFSTIDGNSFLKDKYSQHHVNTYYSGTLSDKIKLDVLADYARTNSRRNQDVTENSDKFGRKEINSHNRAKYDLYAVNGKLGYTVNEHHSFVLGSDWSKVLGSSFLEYKDNAANGARSTTNEHKLAAYLSYYFQQNNFSVNGGLRFEHVRYNFNDLKQHEKSIEKTYNNFFPNFGITYNNKISQTFSYRIGINRPQFGRLNNYSYYLNQFSQQEGNPLLQPQISHKIQYSLAYQFVYFSLGYTYNKDYIGAYYYTDSKNPERYINTWKNFDKQQQLTAILNLDKRFGAYNPSLMTMFMKNIQQVQSVKGILTADKPIWMIQWNNNFHLPHKILFNIEYQFRSKGSIQFFTFNPTHVFNASVSKSWLDDRVQLTLKARDIFRKEIDIYDGRINNIYFWQHEDQDRRLFSLHLTWRFNNYKKSYKGKSAATDELNRL